MRVLFVCSGTSKFGISPIISAQGKSLIDNGVQIEYFTIRQKGAVGYLNSIIKLRRFIRDNKFDIYHAHYGLSAIVATLAGLSPLVVSLMGSDVKGGGLQLRLIKLFSRFYWKKTIAKTKELSMIVGGENIIVIPNGIDLSVFRPSDKLNAKLQLGLNGQAQYILFSANPKRFEKNFPLAKKVIESFSNNDIILLTLNDIKHEFVPLYINASEVVILSSFWEGSPNIIKEAMACNRPAVTTKVGDVEWLFGSEPGYFLADFSTEDFALKLSQAMDYAKEHNFTNGRNRAMQLELDSTSVARKIIGVYNEILEE